jgi:pimeloyl-ACP methyl ester carboxylesterase
MAQDVRTLLDHLDVKKLHAWVGVSMGAAVGIVFAAKYPGVIARLVPCDTISMSPVNAGTPDVFGPRVSAAREAGNMHATVEGTLERWFGRPWMGSNAAETERMRKLMHGTSIDGFDACCAALRSTSFDLRPLAAKAGSGADSAMLLVGEKDTPLIQSMEELRQGIERGLRSKKDEAATVELRIVKNGGHVCFVDGFESFVGHITKFLA